ncbi:MAG: hypothetical protein IJP72_03585 [Bacteroidales bacterium]|nr:hypothetical protein [Bacteroidales bacterium]
MTITEDELQRIVARAVKVALNEIKGEGEVEKDKQPQTTSPVEAKPMSEDELDAAMKLMASNRGKDDEPKVGIFWYDPRTNDLFGVRSHRVSDYTKANSRTEFGSISCSEMHEDVWKKEFHRQKYKNGGIGPFTGAYEMVPRGRIFYNPETMSFTIAVGSWIEQFPQAVALIVKEFNLEGATYEVKTAHHWDIGQKWL